MTILDIQIQYATAPPPPPAVLYDGWRCKHKGEPGAPDNPDKGLPEVRPSFWQNGIEFGLELQRLSFDLMRHFNPSVITSKRWRAVYDGDRAFTNNQGWDDDKNPDAVFADYINGQDIGAEPPKLMKVTICGGSFYHGDAIGDKLWLYPGVHGIDANAKTLSTLAEVIVNNWFFHAVDWHDYGKIAHFAQGWDGADYYGPVVIPLVLSVPVSYPLSWFDRWVGDTQPDPLKYGG